MQKHIRSAKLPLPPKRLARPDRLAAMTVLRIGQIASTLCIRRVDVARARQIVRTDVTSLRVIATRAEREIGRTGTGSERSDRASVTKLDLANALLVANGIARLVANANGLQLDEIDLQLDVTARRHLAASDRPELVSRRRESKEETIKQVSRLFSVRIARSPHFSFERSLTSRLSGRERNGYSSARRDPSPRQRESERRQDDRQQERERPRHAEPSSASAELAPR